MATVILPTAVSQLWIGLCLVCLLGYGIVAVPDRLWDRLPIKRYLAALGAALGLAGAYVILVDVDCNWWWWCCVGVICLW